MTSTSTSSSLIRQAQNHSPEAWKRLSQLYTPLVFQWCKQSRLQTADIADIAQNVFTSVYKNIDRFHLQGPKSTFCGWLWTITRNEIRAHHRRQASRLNATGGTEGHNAIEQVAEEARVEIAPSRSAAMHCLVHGALEIVRSEFEPNTWQAFLRTTLDDQPAPEVAQELGLSAGAVRQAKYRVLLRLREFLEGN